jgi:hypothetical protein
MKLLWDGLSVIMDNWQLVLGILALMLLAQLSIHLLMKWIFGQELAEDEYLSLDMAGWLVPASLLSLLWHGLRSAGSSPSVALTFVLLVIVVAILFLLRVKKEPSLKANAIRLGLLSLVLLFFFLRLAFASRIILPPYFDSIRHYMIIQSLLRDTEPSAPDGLFPWLTNDYYHIGFHLVAGFIQSIVHADTARTMSILGQMTLAVTPLALFCPVKHTTGSNRAALFAVLLGSIGWSMPAYAVNWGKYPAITSLTLILFVLGIGYLVTQSRHTLARHRRSALYALLFCGILLAGLFHTRSLVVVAIFVVAWLAAGAWQRLPGLSRSLVVFLIVLGIALEIFLIQRQDVLTPLFEPYGGKWFLATLFVFFLSIFAQRVYPKFAFAMFLGLLILLGSLFVPTPDFIPRFANLTLLDRTFVEMCLYLPLSLLGGSGLAGFEQLVRHTPAGRWTRPTRRDSSAGLLFIALISGYALMQYDFYPSDCCILAGQNDFVAMDWVRTNLPSDARILISADEVVVQASGTPQGYAAADAGGWITPLTGRATVPLWYVTNLGRAKKFKSLCKMGVDYIYIGSVGRSFYAPRLRAHPEWYRPLLSISRTEVYQVTGCR